MSTGTKHKKSTRAPIHTKTSRNGNQAFHAKKAKVLSSLQEPPDTYRDASPKGSVDDGIRDLIDLINTFDDLFTTSSCAGRTAVFLDHGSSLTLETEEHLGPVVSDSVERPATNTRHTFRPEAVTPEHASSTSLSTAGFGKGAGGSWLFVSHERLSPPDAEKLIHILEHRAERENRATQRFDSPELPLIHFKFEPMVIHKLLHS